MEVKLLTSLSTLKDMEENARIAALTCHANTKSPVTARELLSKIITWKHESILEHITLTYSVKNISRALLQELARHRHVSLSVESTRHTLKKKIGGPDKLGDVLKNVPEQFHEVLDAALKFIFFTSEKNNDVLKYVIPECWPTNLILTLNIRELRHILDVRTAKAALKEFRILVHELFNVVPDEFKYLLKDCVHEETEA